MKQISWVIGSGGLLGSALCRAVDADSSPRFDPAGRFSWTAPSQLPAQMVEAVARFADQAAQADRWEIYWAAGVGTMRSPGDVMQTETSALAGLLRQLSAQPALLARPGRIALASSAGAIYAGSSDRVLTEHSAPAPTTPYAHEKLRQEAMLEAFTRQHAGIGASVLRISTLYGAGQAPGKPQGLLTHMAQCIVRGLPIHIYVSLDTIRDYVAVDDAARAIVLSLRSPGHARFHLKIIAAERPTTISEIISIFRRIARRAPRIVASATRDTHLYASKTLFHSVAEPQVADRHEVSLVVGIARVLEYERRRHARASLTDSPLAS